MKNTIFVSAWMLIVFLALSTQQTKGQAGTCQIESTPYEASIGDVVAQDSISLDSVQAVVKYMKAGQADVHCAFLSDRIYLMLDLNGMREVYVTNLIDSWEGAQLALFSNGISESKFSHQAFVNCLLKYHANK